MAPTKKPHHDDTDVESALSRETADGSGFDTEDALPAEDFESFFEDDVENDHDGDNEADPEEANE